MHSSSVALHYLVKIQRLVDAIFRRLDQETAACLVHGLSDACCVASAHQDFTQAGRPI